MRRAFLLFVACGSTPTEPAAPPVPTSEPAPAVAAAPTCSDAAFGIEASSKDLRAPDDEIVPQLRARCLEESWPDAAIACFAKLRGSDDFLPCVSQLAPSVREPLLVQIRGGTPGEDPAAQQAELDAVKQRLATVAVGIKSCDELVQQVARMMSCEGIPVSDRILLGTETAEAWSLSTSRLTVQDKLRVSGGCGKSLDDLERHAKNLSC